MSIVIGLTGNIACGKSTVGKIFQKMGIQVLDSDDLVHEIYETDTQVQEQLLKEFGSLDRKEIAKQVFGKDKTQKRKILESIIHPKVDSKFREWILKNREEKILVNLVPLLFEAHLEHRYDRIITVFANKEQQIQRLQLREPTLTTNAILTRIESQLPIEEKLRKSDFYIDNTQNFDDLELQIEEILESIAKQEKLILDLK